MINTFTIEEIKSMQLDWINNFLSIDNFANYYSLTLEQAHEVISYNRSLKSNYSKSIKDVTFEDWLK